MEDLQDLLDRELTGFLLPQRFRDWCGNTKGNVYAYPHVSGKGEDPCAGVVMLANRKLMEDCSISGDSFANKEDTLRALKTIRKARPDVIPSYMDLAALQQMFGARVQDQDGDWQDVFFQEETLEALKYMNLLYSERLLSQDVFTMTQRYLLSQLREEKVFLAATGPLYSLLQSLPEDDLIWEKYEIVGPMAPDSGKDVWSDVWQHAGWDSIIYIAALAAVDPALYEAATVDGAGKWQKIKYIDIPFLLPTAVILLIMRAGSIMNVGFEKVYLMQNPLNTMVSEVIATYVYKIGIISNQYSLSAAVGLFNNIINFILLLLVNQVSKKMNDTSLF